MSRDLRITNHGVQVPVVAFFGTKGGVGKTTISRRFAELVTLAPDGPNVLLVDADVHQRGMSVHMTADTPVTCKTVHDYVASQNTSDVEAANLSGMVTGARPGSGDLFFIPASTPEADEVFAKSAAIGPDRLLEILYEVMASAVQQYDCRCVVIDCGPVVGEPYTSAAAMLADRAFIIGQNEAISFSSLKVYPSKVRDFYPDFSISKMKVIINKVRGYQQLEERRLQEDIFAAIPFTMDIVDISEGITDVNQMQLMIFEDHIAKIVERVFAGDHPELIPERKELLPPEWDALMDGADRLEQAAPVRRLGLLRMLLPIGILALLGGVVLVFAATSDRHRTERAEHRDALVEALQVEIGTATPDAADGLRQALTLAEQVDEVDGETLDQALAAAQEAGLEDIPLQPRGDTSRENLGIVVLLVGLVLSAIGFACARKRKDYLEAVQGLRKGGAEWLMGQLKRSKKARRTFDRLRRMAQ